jgi:hypothetical protein
MEIPGPVKPGRFLLIRRVPIHRATPMVFVSVANPMKRSRAAQRTELSALTFCTSSRELSFAGGCLYRPR